MQRVCHVAGAIALGLALSPLQIGAQQATVIRQYIDTVAPGIIDTLYTVRIGADTLNAITTARARRVLLLKENLKTVERELVLKDSLLARYEQTVQKYAAFREHDRAYVAALQSQLEDYKKLTSLLKKRRTGSWLTFDAGVGATADWDPAVLAGIGFHQLRFWGFLQEGNAGGILGIQIPVF